MTIQLLLRTQTAVLIDHGSNKFRDSDIGTTVKKHRDVVQHTWCACSYWLRYGWYAQLFGRGKGTAKKMLTVGHSPRALGYTVNASCLTLYLLFFVHVRNEQTKVAAAYAPEDDSDNDSDTE